MSTINVTINDHAAEFTNMPIISSGSVNVDKIQFTFDDTWNNFTGRVCVFYKQRGQYWYGNINSSGIVNIPIGVMSLEGTITLGVSGYYNGAIKTTEVLSYNIYEGTYTDVSDGDYETFEEIKNQMLAIQSQIESATDDVLQQIEDLSAEVDTLVDTAVSNAIGGSDVIEDVKNDVFNLQNATFTRSVPTYTFTSGKVVSSPSGNIINNSEGYRITSPIPVTAGTIVSYVAKVNNAIATLAFSTNSEATTWQVCLTGTKPAGQTELHNYRYTITQSGYIIITSGATSGLNNLCFIDSNENFLNKYFSDSQYTWMTGRSSGKGYSINSNNGYLQADLTTTHPQAVLRYPIRVYEGMTLKVKNPSKYRIVIHAYNDKEYFDWLPDSEDSNSGLSTAYKGRMKDTNNVYELSEYTFGSNDNMSYPVKIRIVLIDITSTNSSVGISEDEASDSFIFTGYPLLSSSIEVDRINSILGDLYSQNLGTVDDIEWYNDKGYTLKSSDGAIIVQTAVNYYRAFNQDFILVKKSGETITLTEDYAYLIYFYDINGEYLGRNGYNFNVFQTGTFTFDSRFQYPIKIRLLVKRASSNSSMNLDDIKSSITFSEGIVFPKKDFINIPPIPDSVTLSNINSQFLGKEIVDSNYSPLTIPNLDFSPRPVAYTSAQETAYITNVKNNYNAFMSEVAGRYDRIPMILFTDSHGLIDENNKAITLIGDLVNWDNVSRIINLGDVVYAGVRESCRLGGSVQYGSVAYGYVENDLIQYDKAMRAIPSHKRLEVWGNHDAYYYPPNTNTNAAQPTRYTDRYLKHLDSKRFNDQSVFSVVDEYYNVRYVSVLPRPINNLWNYDTCIMDSEQLDWIINELTNSKEDIILLCHWYMYHTDWYNRDGELTGQDGGDKWLKYATERNSFRDMLIARKNKLSGVVYDNDNNAHAYNFADCSSELLMIFAGHRHDDAYGQYNSFSSGNYVTVPDEITIDPVTMYVCQSFRYKQSSDTSGTDPQYHNCFYFAYIDRKTHKFKNWKNIAVSTNAIEIDI